MAMMKSFLVVATTCATSFGMHDDATTIYLSAGGGGGNLNYTCAPGQPGASLPFCDRSLGFKKRAADLAGRLNITEHVNLFFSYPGTPWIERFNMKGWSLDHTCIHGLNKNSGVTVFPHAIAQGASWDLDLITRVSNITAIEGRIVSAQAYVKSRGGNAGGALSCDGGPLANSAHDPRWGRISETYGEDPIHIQTVGVAVMNGLQNPQPVPGSSDPSDRFLATRQVTRHYIAYHGGSGDTINGTGYPAEYNATNRSLADSYFPTYGAYQRPDQGAADGIMCAMTELNGIPSCVDPLLMTEMLRNEWQSDAIVQTDCCDSIGTIHSMKYKNWTTAEALANSVNMGLGNYFGYDVSEMRTFLAWALGNNTVSEDTIRTAGERVILSHMKLGFYDMHADDYPFKNESIPWSLLDSDAHRSVAREATAKSTVLLKNDGILPMNAASTSTIAVVGPFAKCIVAKGMNGTCYLHSYNGYPSNITDIYTGIKNVVPSTVWAEGSNMTCGWRCKFTESSPPAACWETPGPAQDAIQAAVEAASKADTTILTVGLGANVEGEGCDRFNLTLPAVQQALQNAVQAVAKKLIIVVVSAGGVDIDDSKANAIIWAPYGGEEAGSGLADVVFGKVNPSAKLPVTFYKQAWFDKMTDKLSTSLLNMNLEVGSGRTHRYLKDHAMVKYWFGAGLSYTMYAYSNLQVTKDSNNSLTVAVDVSNTGKIAGSEVVQAYIQSPSAQSPDPFVNLIGFAKVDIDNGKQQTVTISVTPDRLETAFDDRSRKIVPGDYTLWACGHHPFDTIGSESSCVKSTLTL